MVFNAASANVTHSRCSCRQSVSWCKYHALVRFLSAVCVSVRMSRTRAVLVGSLRLGANVTHSRGSCRQSVSRCECHALARFLSAVCVSVRMSRTRAVLVGSLHLSGNITYLRFLSFLSAAVCVSVPSCLLFDGVLGEPFCCFNTVQSNT